MRYHYFEVEKNKYYILYSEDNLYSNERKPTAIGEKRIVDAAYNKIKKDDDKMTTYKFLKVTPSSNGINLEFKMIKKEK